MSGCIGIGCAETAESAAVAAFAPADIRGSAIGLLATMQGIGNVAAIAVAGLLHTVTSPGVAFAYLATWMLVALVTLAWACVPRRTQAHRYSKSSRPSRHAGARPASRRSGEVRPHDGSGQPSKAQSASDLASSETFGSATTPSASSATTTSPSSSTPPTGLAERGPAQTDRRVGGSRPFGSSTGRTARGPGLRGVTTGEINKGGQPDKVSKRCPANTGTTATTKHRRAQPGQQMPR